MIGHGSLSARKAASADTSLPWLPELFLCFSDSFSSGLSGMSLKEEQLSPIKAVYEA